MKVYYVISGVVFLLFAALQINDPDPIIWVYTYLYSVFLSAYYFKRNENKAYVLLGLISYIVGAIQLWPMNLQGWLHSEEQARGLDMSLPFVEEARESMGLLIAALHCGFILLKKNAHGSK